MLSCLKINLNFSSNRKEFFLQLKLVRLEMKLFDRVLRMIELIVHCFLCAIFTAYDKLENNNNDHHFVKSKK